jgi:VWFA-related protein
MVSLIAPSGSASFSIKDPSEIVGPSSQEKPLPPQPPQEKHAPDPRKTGSSQEKDEAIRISSKLVLVPVSASDAEGRSVKDLKVEEIVIEEEGRPQQVVSLGEPGKTPVDIALLFDVSGSTHGQFAFQQQAAIQFIKEVLKPGDGISLFSVGLTPRRVKERTTSGEEAIQGILAIEPLKEPTAFFDSVVEAARYIEKSTDSGSRRVLVVISDGEENFSTRNDLDDALRELQRNDCLFYAINPSGGGIRLNIISLKGQSNLEAMASQTGGKAFNLAKLEELAWVFRLIAEDLKAQYLFGYYSADERADGGFRRITVRSKRPNLRIRARQGYYVPKAEENQKEK